MLIPVQQAIMKVPGIFTSYQQAIMKVPGIFTSYLLTIQEPLCIPNFLLLFRELNGI